jgi:hypothetical protein
MLLCSYLSLVLYKYSLLEDSFFSLSTPSVRVRAPIDVVIHEPSCMVVTLY